MIYEFMFVDKFASLISLGRRVNSTNSCCMQLHFIRAVITFEAVCLFLAEGMKYKRGAFQWGGREFGTVNYLVTLYWICLWSYKNAIRAFNLNHFTSSRIAKSRIAYCYYNLIWLYLF